MSTLFSARAFVSLACAALAACGGGSSAGNASAPAPIPAAAAPQPLSASIAFTYRVPGATASSARRTPRYVAPTTYQAVVVVTPQNGTAGAPQIFPCTNDAGNGKVCSGAISAAPGVDTVAITLEDAPVSPATRGNALSRGVTVMVVNAGTANTLNATLDGIVRAVKIVLAAPNVQYLLAGADHAMTVPTYAAVNALDADGNVITYNGAYVDKNGNNFGVTLAASSLCAGSPLCSVSLGATSIGGPGTLVPVTATLDDHVAELGEALTITPSVAFGDPSVPLTAGTTTFQRYYQTTKYGTGTAGALSVASGQTVDYSATANPNLNFTTVNVAAGGTLVLPGGSTLYALGTLTVNGTVRVPRNASATAYSSATPTLASLRATTVAGGAGAGNLPGAGGGLLIAQVAGSVGGSGAIDLSGGDGSTSDIGTGDGGGGGGGAVFLAARGGFAHAAIRITVAGGAGGAGGRPVNSTNYDCNGGGGAGGFIELVGPSATSSTVILNVSGGAAGPNAPSAGATAASTSSGGGAGGNALRGAAPGAACTDTNGTLSGPAGAGASGSSILVTTELPETQL